MSIEYPRAATVDRPVSIRVLHPLSLYRSNNDLIFPREPAHVIKLLGIDVDGTFLGSHGEPPEANIEAVAAAAAAGVRIAIVTGRSFHFALPPVDCLPDPLTLIVYNGAIARMRSGQTLISRLLPRVEARQVLDCTWQWRDSALLQFDRPNRGQLVYDRLDWTHPNRVRFKQKNLALIEEVSALEDALTEDPIQIAFNGSVATMRELVRVLTSLREMAHLSISVTEYAHRDFALVDVCASETTKGSTLSRLAELIGVRREEVMAVGDNYNDREMLEWAGVGVVMGNATAEMKARFEVTGTNDEAGLAQAIRRHIRL
jgi:Cof subfamily protein (haloacid dehalogenase superfamily)